MNAPLAWQWFMRPAGAPGARGQHRWVRSADGASHRLPSGAPPARELSGINSTENSGEPKFLPLHFWVRHPPLVAARNSAYPCFICVPSVAKNLSGSERLTAAVGSTRRLWPCATVAQFYPPPIRTTLNTALLRLAPLFLPGVQIQQHASPASRPVTSRFSAVRIRAFAT